MSRHKFRERAKAACVDYYHSDELCDLFSAILKDLKQKKEDVLESVLPSHDHICC